MDDLVKRLRHIAASYRACGLVMCEDYDAAVARIEELEIERDNNAAALREFIADRDRLAARIEELERERDSYRNTANEMAIRAAKAEGQVEGLAALLKEAEDALREIARIEPYHWIGNRASAFLARLDEVTKT